MVCSSSSQAVTRGQAERLMVDLYNNIIEARSECCGPLALYTYMGLLYLNAAKAAVSFEIEGLIVIRLLGVAVIFYTGKRGFDVVFDTDVFVDTDLDTAEIAVEGDNRAIRDVGTT